VIFAAVRSAEGDRVFGLVLLAERSEGVLFTKPIAEDMGPAEDFCPERILDLLTEPSNDNAAQWRERCRARLAQGRPKPGDAVAFASPLKFVDGTEHRCFTFVGVRAFARRKAISITCLLGGRSTSSYPLSGVRLGAP
jgi:hypothetical protein